MVQDFGGGGQASWRRGQRLAFVWQIAGRAGLVAGFLVLASLPTTMAISDMRPEAAPKAEGGRACPSVAKSEFLHGWRQTPRLFRYRGVAFARRHGDASCSVGRDGPLGRSFPVCEFTAPVEVAVTAGGRETYFDVGPGFSAVIEARPAAPRCVITGRLRL